MRGNATWRGKLAFVRLAAVIAAVIAPLASGALVPAEAATRAGSTSYTTSTSFHVTFIRQVEPTIDQYQTRIIGQLNVSGGVVTMYDQTFAARFDSAEVNAGVQQANISIVNGPCAPGTQVWSISPLSRVYSHLSIGTVYRGSFHIIQTVTVTHTVGPASIFIGLNQSQTLFVPEGSDNYNTNTNETLAITEVRQTVFAHSETYVLFGSCTSGAA
jgi:hypothetical protein